VCSQAEHCVTGECQLICPASQIACGATCVDPDTDNQHCGAHSDCFGSNAGTACGAGQVCDGTGACNLSCQSGLVSCGGRCTDPNTDDQHCGASGDCTGANAGAACPAGQVCDGSGHCALSCQAGLVACGGTCVDPQTNPDYCGASGDCAQANAGSRCASDQRCSGGQCAVRCPNGQVYCGTQCIDPNTDPMHCGADAACAGGTSCVPSQVCNGAGSCAPACATGFVLCGGRCVATGQCPACGNGGICNTADLGGATCASLGLGAGLLLCDPLSCRYDTSMCAGGGGSGGIGGSSGH
jgi:hypothetical protein